MSDLGDEREREHDAGEGGGAAVDPRAWRAPAAAVAVAGLLAVALRAPFFGAPLTADEGGYGEVARLWSHGATLYRDAWVDRPQGLELVFRAILHVDGGSATAMRALAAVVAAGVAALTMAVTARVAGRIAAVGAGLLVATAGASPFIESFTLSGELLASLAACASMLAFVTHLRSGRREWLVVAGLLTGCAVMLKQSGFDAGAAAALYLVITRRREGLAPVAVLVGRRARPGRRRRGAGGQPLGLVVRARHLPRPGRLDRDGLAFGPARHGPGLAPGRAQGARADDRPRDSRAFAARRSWCGSGSPSPRSA